MTYSIFIVQDRIARAQPQHHSSANVDTDHRSERARWAHGRFEQSQNLHIG